MSFLEDIHEAIVSGEVSAPKASRPNEWNEGVRWTFGGYLARVRSIQCESCHAETWTTLGVFAEELASNGTRRLTRATQWEQIGKKRMEVESGETVPLCHVCLSKLGFSDLIDAPSTLTNISGEGFSPFRGKTSLSFSRLEPKEPRRAI